MDLSYISTTKIAEANGIQTAAMFEKLLQLNYIVLNNSESKRKWELTDKGIAIGGRYASIPNLPEYIEWPSNLKFAENENVIDEPTFKSNSNSEIVLKIADTEGEKYVKSFFAEFGIEYQQQKVIRNLSFDNKAHRVADFYLPKYSIYVEFFGNWNTNNFFRNEYINKREVYKKNHIPCIYIYPENLGYLDFVFDHRLMETLKDNHMEKQLNSYRVWKVMKGASLNFIGLFIAIVVSIVFFLFKIEGQLFFLFLFLFNLYKIISLWHLEFVKTNLSLRKMLYD